MRIFSCFAWALINAGGRIGPDDVVTGKLLFGVVMSAIVGYVFGWAVEELLAWVRSRRIAR